MCYRLVPGDHLLYRYEILNELGRGSFGVVIRVFDHKKKKEVAIKVIKNKEAEHYASTKEVKMLEQLSGSPGFDGACIVNMLGYFYFRNHLCTVLELLHYNLWTFLKLNNFKLPVDLVKVCACPRLSRC